MFKYLILPFLVIFSTSSYAKRTDCITEKKQLQNIQKIMKKGYKPRLGEYYRKIEREKHDAYQICRRNKNNSSKKTNVKNHKKQTKKNYSSLNKSRNYNRPLVSRGTINIKGKFKGEKQSAWLRHYKTPKNCLTPKTIPEFAKCLSIRDKAAEKFDILWRKNNAPASIKLD